MRKTLLLPICLCVLLSPALAGEKISEKNVRVLGEKSVVSVITQDPGNEIYLSFGHSAIRVRDDAQGIDVLFNYGVFSASSLSDPMFIPRFLHGELDYILYPFSFSQETEYDLKTQNRVWYEQVLNLDEGERNRLFRFLVWNAQPENCVYRYDFIKDNCATRVMDAFDKGLGPVIDFSAWKPSSGRFTYRGLIDEKLDARPAWQLTLDLLLGSASDKKMTPHESMYMPSYLMDILARATIRHGDRDEPLVVSSAKVLDPTSPADYSSRALNPNFILWPLAFLALVSAILEMLARSGPRSLAKVSSVMKVLDSVFFVALGLLGCLVFYLAFLSTHAATKGNLNVLFLLPTNIVAPFLIFSRKRRSPLAWYWLAVAILAALPLLLLPVWPQYVNPMMIPLLIIIAVRALSIFAGKRRTVRGDA
jgi:hypothetical protein